MTITPPSNCLERCFIVFKDIPYLFPSCLSPSAILETRQEKSTALFSETQARDHWLMLAREKKLSLTLNGELWDGVGPGMGIVPGVRIGCWVQLPWSYCCSICSFSRQQSVSRRSPPASMAFWDCFRYKAASLKFMPKAGTYSTKRHDTVVRGQTF